ncbi:MULTISPECIES: hypothetical protein [Haloferacaceae]|uniref:Uncharacterized protein n=1 Tax=Halorubrum glutamatedens TaxID=2707018 RepID=A0ABD5QWH6_9EURY|nr:hypothetical protein [Halobellus captivus]
MTGTELLLVTGLLSNHFRGSVAVAILAGGVLLRFRRYRAVSAAAVGAVSSTATVVVSVLVVLLGLVALGYWDPPVSEIVGDVLGAGRVLYDLVGEWLVRQTLGRLKEFAA